MTEPATYQALADALSHVGVAQPPAEYHGALCGALCVLEPGRIDLLRLLEGEAAVNAAADSSALAQLRDDTEAALAGESPAFELVLPPDDQTLEQRTRALVAWCDGFLYGLASQNQLDLQKASSEVQEAVSDITQFTRATLEQEDDTETEEVAFAELVEYLRVAVQLIYMELRRAPSASPARMH